MNSNNEDKIVQLGDSFFKAGMIALVIGFSWVIFSPQNDFAWLVFQTGLMLCFINCLSLLHELGHTIFAYLTGAHIFQVSVGMGKVLFKFDFLGIEWIFHKVPFSGYTSMGFTVRKFYRLKNFFVSLGGPLINFLFVFIPIPLLFILNSPWLLALLKSFIIANIFDFFHSIAPRNVDISGSTYPSDGLRLLSLAFLSESQINQEIESVIAWQKQFE